MKTAYYARPKSWYGTPEDAQNIALIEKLGFKVIDPNQPHLQLACKDRGMIVFLEIVETCGAVFFQAYRDGVISAGVEKEIAHALSNDIPVIEIPVNTDLRAISVAATRCRNDALVASRKSEKFSQQTHALGDNFRRIMAKVFCREMIHKLKTWSGFYEAVVDGRKTFEVRKRDRDFRLHDTLLLQEFDPERKRYTGRETRRKITFILNGGQFGVEDGFVVLGLEKGE